MRLRNGNGLQAIARPARAEHRQGGSLSSLGNAAIAFEQHGRTLTLARKPL